MDAPIIDAREMLIQHLQEEIAYHADHVRKLSLDSVYMPKSKEVQDMINKHLTYESQYHTMLLWVKCQK